MKFAISSPLPPSKGGNLSATGKIRYSFDVFEKCKINFEKKLKSFTN
jgi:hypothetical protein